MKPSTISDKEIEDLQNQFNIKLPELYTDFWKSNKNIDLSDEKIMFKLRKLPETVDENIICNFDDLPIHEFYD